MSSPKPASDPSNEHPGLIGKILRRTRSKQNVAPASAPQIRSPAAVTTSTPPNAAATTNRPEVNPLRHNQSMPEQQPATSHRPSGARHRSRPSLISLMQQPATETRSSLSSTPVDGLSSSQLKVSLRSRFNKADQGPAAIFIETPPREGPVRRSQPVTAERSGTARANVVMAQQCSLQHASQSRDGASNAEHAHITTATPAPREPHIEIHDGTEDDSSDYQKFIQQAVEDDRRQRELWRTLASQQTYKVVAEATGPAPKPGIFSWQRSAEKKQKEEDRRRAFAGEGQLYGFPASEASCELSRKSSRSSSRLSRKSSIKQMIIDYIKPPQPQAEYDKPQHGITRKTSSQGLI
ncbi:hypothetical protein Micbo1qcDRAFT_200560 [Microdochium bolleyi]|uniref:Uncharacterized protein n=1 Tax=Microdochium bolleyi TaxID=196109 RepID=A0A136JDB1_9PEZI|nr:hypothetical protein Micbo1qcDRAFT_200560 [Microdochium bolleyi]